MTGPTRLGFFTRLLDQGDAAERYRVATQQILHAEAEGFDSAWIAQHHFHEMEGGLPAPFVFLAQVAARTTRIRLGTGVVTLPMEMPIRVAEDAAVLDLMSGGRLELGVGSGGNPAAFAAFGMQDADRRGVFREKLDQLLAALEGASLPGGDRIYPQRASLRERIWYATFSVEGARHAGEIGAGLMLSRTQPRPSGMSRDVPVAAIQEPMIDAYLDALPAGVAPRILASRSVFVADTRAEALRWAEVGLRNYQAILAKRGQAEGGPLPIETLIRHQDVHIGTPAEVAESLLAERVFQRSTDLAVQVHSVDPPHAQVMRSIELMAREVAPMIGLRREPMRKVA